MKLTINYYRQDLHVKISGGDNMTFPKLIPDFLCQTPIKILISQGLNERGSEITKEIDDYCNYQEKIKILYTKKEGQAEKQIQCNGTIIINHDIEPDEDQLNGGYVIINNIKRTIAISIKNRDFWNNVNYVTLEVI